MDSLMDKITLILVIISALLGFALGMWYIFAVQDSTKTYWPNTEAKKWEIRALKLVGYGLSAFFIFTMIFIVIGRSTIPIDHGVYALKGSEAYQSYTWELLVASIYLPAIIAATLIALALVLWLIRRTCRPGKYNSTWNDKKPFVFYLRSFVDDNQTGKQVTQFFMPVQTEEEALVSVLDDIAPVVALGNPLDKYTPEGATRLYVSDEEWKQKVIDLAGKSKFIVLRLGETQSFWWEVKWCFENIDLHKVLFVIPSGKKSKTLFNLYQSLQENNIGTGNLAKHVKRAAKGSITGFLYFDQDNQPVYKTLRKNWFITLFAKYDDLLRESLVDFLSKFGKIYKPRNLETRSIILWICTILVVGISLLSTYQNTQSGRFPYDLGIMARNNAAFYNAYGGQGDEALLLQVFQNNANSSDQAKDETKSKIDRFEKQINDHLTPWEADQLQANGIGSDQYYRDWAILSRIYLDDAEYGTYLQDLLSVAVMEIPAGQRHIGKLDSGINWWK